MPAYDKLLVLDLDETLVHARRVPLERAPEFSVGPFVVYRRPHVSAFLEDVLDAFESVGVWTASTLPYALPVLDHLVDRRRLAFVWGRERCTYHYDREHDETVWLKPLTKLRRAGFRKERVLYVDDSPEKIVRSYSNLVAVAPFIGDPADDELPRLATYLHTLGPVANVRPIEKRGWRRRRGQRPS
ncbi:MAG: HAD family hydrolase [Myxococcota bacterium]